MKSKFIIVQFIENGKLSLRYPVYDPLSGQKLDEIEKTRPNIDPQNH